MKDLKRRLFSPIGSEAIEREVEDLDGHVAQHLHALLLVAGCGTVEFEAPPDGFDIESSALTIPTTAVAMSRCSGEVRS